MRKERERKRFLQRESDPSWIGVGVTASICPDAGITNFDLELNNIFLRM